MADWGNDFYGFKPLLAAILLGGIGAVAKMLNDVIMKRTVLNYGSLAMTFVVGGFLGSLGPEVAAMFPMHVDSNVVSALMGVCSTLVISRFTSFMEKFFPQ